MLGAMSVGAAVVVVGGSPSEQRGLVVAVACIAVAFGVLGLYDDLYSVPALARLGVQILIAASGVGALLAQTSDDIEPGLLISLGGVVVIVAYVNAFNFMDGVNGISALNAAITGATLSYLLHLHSQDLLAAMAAVTAAAAIGFLPWNAPRARIFLGDVGSYGIGASLAVLAVLAVATGANWLLCSASLFVYALDTAVTVTRRGLRGEPLMTAHREHVYQRLVDVGWGHIGAAFACAGASAVVCGWALVVAELTWPVWVVVPVAVFTGAVYVALPRLAASRVPRQGGTDTFIGPNGAREHSE